jgi:hypothetical protein
VAFSEGIKLYLTNGVRENPEPASNPKRMNSVMLGPRHPARQGVFRESLASSAPTQL